jgi:hypothetical protein
MDDVKKDHTEEDCPCTKCMMARRLGYAGREDLQKDLLSPINEALGGVLNRYFAKIDNLRIQGRITPDEAAETRTFIATNVIHQLLYGSGQIAHHVKLELGQFVGLAAEHWVHTKPSPFVQILESILGSDITDSANPFFNPSLGREESKN